ncbi:MAG TPA: ATP-binding protein [Myxococcales bacterium]|jgi:signal transduction histidine kinase
MRLYQKLVLFMLAAAVGPVAVVGFALLGRAQDELRSRITEQQLSVAVSAAELAARDVEEAVESLTRTASSIRWADLSGDERAGALRLLVGQSRHFVVASVIDSTSGETSLKVSGGPEDLAPFKASLPLAELAKAEPGAVAMSDAYLRVGARASSLAVSVQGGVVAVEFSLRALMERSKDSARSGAGELWFFDAGSGKALAAPSTERLEAPIPARAVEIAKGLKESSKAWREGPRGGVQMAAVAAVAGRPGWFALVVVPEAVALAPIDRMVGTVLGSMGAMLALLLALGFAFTRSLSRRIEVVAEGARALGRGEQNVCVPESGVDEVGDLARVFNAMGSELDVSRKKLERWNEELQQKVEERTRELKAAQAALLEAQKLAAIGQLGAGVAHEINNPLAGILGNTQLLLLDRPEGDRDIAVLKKIETQAKRAKEITANLLRFSQQRQQADFKPVDLNKLVKETLTLVETQVKAEGVELALALAAGLPPVKGDPGHLAQVLLNLVSNARTAMLKAAPKRLTVSTRSEAGKVHLTVSDTGKGIDGKVLPRIFEPFFTTKDVWSNVGLGLSVSFRVVEEHGGRIEVATEVGKGSAFTVELPAVGP